MSPFTAEDLFEEEGELFALDAAAAATEEEEPTVAVARGDTVAVVPPSFEIA